MSRLLSDLIETSRMGRNPARRVERFQDLDPNCGITRPTGTEANKEIRDFAVQRMREADLEVRVDAVGNIFARCEGTRPEERAVLCGSHLDSVVNGGMLDGALGVFGAIEAIRRFNDEGFRNKRPIEVVVFTGEEGSAFKQLLLGSSVLVGKKSLSEALGMKNEEGLTLAEALERIGYRGTFEWTLQDAAYMVELHVEQGPVLDREGIPVGIVEHITGLNWIMVTILGQGNHAGTTPMTLRRDALVAGSEVVTFIHRRANEMVRDLGGHTVGTVGKLVVFPNGMNIVPNRVEMGIDIRDVRQDNLEHFQGEILEMIKELESRYGVETQVQLPVAHRPGPLSCKVAETIERAARKLGILTRRIVSGAGHDTQNLAEHVESGMIFVPSCNGISHSPMEWTTWEDIEKGVAVLTAVIRELSSVS